MPTNTDIKALLHSPRLLKEVLNGKKAKDESCHQTGDNSWITVSIEDRAMCRLTGK